MALYIQPPLEQLREAFPFLPLVSIGLGMLAFLWLIRRNRKSIKAKPPALKSLERKHAEAIRELSSIKMNQRMDKHLHSIKIPRTKFPPGEKHSEMLKQITEHQKQSLKRNKKTPKQGVS